jgi:hypothetical protein
MKVKHVTLIPAAIGVALATFEYKKTVSSAVPAKPPSISVAKVIFRTVRPFSKFTSSLTAVNQVGLRQRVAGYFQNVSVTAHDAPLQGEALAYADRLWVLVHLVLAAALHAPSGWPERYLQSADRAKKLGGRLACNSSSAIS